MRILTQEQIREFDERFEKCDDSEALGRIFHDDMAESGPLSKLNIDVMKAVVYGGFSLHQIQLAPAIITEIAKYNESVYIRIHRAHPEISIAQQEDRRDHLKADASIEKLRQMIDTNHPTHTLSVTLTWE